MTWKSMLPSRSEKLRIFFRNALRKGCIKIVELDPLGSDSVLTRIEPDETLIVRVDCRTGIRSWFTGRRLLQDDDSGSYQLLCYDAVQKAYWMFKDLWPDRMKKLRSTEDAEQLKAMHYDRIEIELGDRGLIAIDSLSDAYSPTLRFFQWIARP